MEESKGVQRLLFLRVEANGSCRHDGECSTTVLQLRILLAYQRLHADFSQRGDLVERELCRLVDECQRSWAASSIHCEQVLFGILDFDSVAFTEKRFS